MQRFKPLPEVGSSSKRRDFRTFSTNTLINSKNRREEAVGLRPLFQTVIRSERCAIQKDAVSFTAHSRKSRTTTEYDIF